MENNILRLDGGADVNLSVSRGGRGDPLFRMNYNGNFSVKLWKIALCAAISAVILIAASVFVVKCVHDFFHTLNIKKRFREQIMREKIQRARIRHIGKLLKSGRGRGKRRARPAPSAEESFDEDEGSEADK